MDQTGLLQEDSHVKTSVSLGKELVLPEAGPVFGLSIGDLLGIYDHDSQLWKTWELSLFGGLIPFSGRFPKSGIMQNGRIYGQVTWAHRTKGKGYGSWPTPRTQGMCGGTGNWNQLKKNCKDIEEARQMGAGNGGQLNPQWVEWLMGYPAGWTDLKDSETQLSLK